MASARSTLITVFLFLLLVPALAAGQTLMMATTTSTDNTGLLDELAPKFQQETGITLKWIAVGTGKALEIGRNCDVDLLLVHAPAAEKAFVENGYGIDRKQVMYNDFVIIGPAKDPANIQGLAVKKAMRKLHDEKALFFSRGDESGTHKKELTLWENAGISMPVKADWYLETGQGMLSTIRVAEERSGYTLTDRGTYIKYAHNQEGEPALKVLVQGDPVLFNQYSVIAINPARCKETNYDRVRKFTEWITSEQPQAFIGDFKLLGQQLFTPNANP